MVCKIFQCRVEEKDIGMRNESDAIMKDVSPFLAIETGESFHWTQKTTLKIMRNVMEGHCLISQSSHLMHTMVLQLAMHDNPIFL